MLHGDLLRNLLLRLAAERVCTVHWSAKVQEEWKRHLVDDAGYSAAVIERTQGRMEAAFPAANVSGYEGLMTELQLPDPDDRQVLTAAIQVTFNLKVCSPAHHRRSSRGCFEAAHKGEAA